MSPPLKYAAPIRETTIWTVWVIVGVVLFLATVMAMIATKLDQKIGLWVVPIGLVPLIGVPLGVALVQGARNRARARRFTTVVAQAGMRIDTEPRLSQRAEHYQRAAEIIRRLHFFGGDAAGCSWIAWEVEGTRDIPNGAVAFEHEYMVGSGRSSQLVHHTVIAWPAGHPDVPAIWTDQPKLALNRHGWFQRRRFADAIVSMPELEAQLPGWTCYGAVETGRLLAGKAAAVALLAASPKGEDWQIGSGYVVVLYGRFLRPEGFAALLAHGREVLQALR